MNPLIKYKALKKTEFYNFFGLHEIDKKTISKGLTEIKIKPGGFQEHVDITLTLNKSDAVVDSVLKLNRAWIGNEDTINPFGKDIAKSFIDVLIVNEKDRPFKETLVQNLWFFRGKKNKVIFTKEPEPIIPLPTPPVKNFIAVYSNLKQKEEAKLNSQILTMKNKIDGTNDSLIIQIKLAD